MDTVVLDGFSTKRKSLIRLQVGGECIPQSLNLSEVLGENWDKFELTLSFMVNP